MAGEAAMSPRTFLRRFRDATGTSPNEWLIAVRIEEARRILETTDVSIEDVARLAGFGSVATLRHHFAPATKLSPREYRDRFGKRRGTADRGALSVQAHQIASEMTPDGPTLHH